MVQEAEALLDRYVEEVTGWSSNGHGAGATRMTLSIIKKA